MEETQNNSSISLGLGLHARSHLDLKQLVTHYAVKDWILQRLQGPLIKKAHVQARLKFANDSEENWVKVL